MISFYKKYKYVTRRYHGSHPAGSECIAWREPGSEYHEHTLCLQFDKEIVILNGSDYYLEGLEKVAPTIWDLMSEAVAREIDEEVLGDLNRCLKESKNG